MATKKTVFSGIQPSGGGLMLGNFIGAIRNWKTLEQTHDCLYCIVDLHAITVKQEPQTLRQRSYEALALYLACGLDAEKNTLFFQSHVAAHTELAWLLTCVSYMGELSRMTQFKDKSAKAKNIGTGLFTYPVLMAADILLYQTNLVPVGADQKQHLELARDLAIRFNNTFEQTFAVPEVFIPQVGAKIMSLQDPTSKMSKSDPDPNATVFLLDSDDLILKKVKKAVTDSGAEISFAEDKPGVANLLTIQSALTGIPIEKIVANYSGKQYGHLKVGTAEIIVEKVRPIREKCEAFLADKPELDRIAAKGAERARERAQKTMAKVKGAMGFASS